MAAANELPSKTLISRALQINNKLSFQDFIHQQSDQSGLSNVIDDIDKFWIIIRDNLDLIIDDLLLTWCGYTGKFREKKKNFKRLLIRNKIRYTEKPGKGNRRHLHMNPDNFKNAVKFLTTRNGKEFKIRMSQFAQMVKSYSIYESVYRDRTLRESFDEEQRCGTLVKYENAGTNKEELVTNESKPHHDKNRSNEVSN